jgi:DNA helicase-2/ATP-dependent DNA helicase PcrA
VEPSDLAAVYRRYEHEKVRRGLVDFDDLLWRCAGAIEGDPEFAAAQRWCWRHIYVDEFQDLNPLQHRLLLAWLGPSVDLCVVGDPNQAIYGWNGADPGLLDGFADRWPTGAVLRLDANHRSTGRIVRVAAAVLGADGRHLTGSERAVPEVVEFESDRVEARGIAGALVEAREAGRPWSAMAVLTRTNAQLVVIEEALGLAGVPWWSAASAALLDQPEVRRFLTGLRSVAGRPLRAALADLEEMVDGVGGLAPGGSVPGAGGGAGDDGGRAGLVALLDIGRTLAASRPESTVGDWLAWLPAGTRDRSDGRPDGSDVVTLSSFHRAKGLEWPLVWVAGVEEGLVPMGKARSETAEREERRLLYVALTRAVDELHVSWAASRSFGGRPVPRRPSRWLEAVVEACVAEGGVGAGVTAGGVGRNGPPWRQRLDEQRAALRRSIRPEAGGAEDAEYESAHRALCAWRVEAARQSGIPPRVLLHDATLEAIAVHRPSTLEQLLEMPGLGPVKVGRYGPLILELLARRVASA